MALPEEIIPHLPEIEYKLGYAFKDRSLLATAFVHRSYANEHRDIGTYNERLEFLGDAALGYAVANALYTLLPEAPEGELSHLRAQLIDAAACTAYLQQLDVGSYILLGKGEQRSLGRGRDSIHADLFEAIVGAIALDGGLRAAEEFIFSHFATTMESLIENPATNWKANLQDRCQKLGWGTPSYEVIEETGPDHNKNFVVAVCCGERELGRGEGRSKKEAQQIAAERAFAALKSEGSQ